MVLEQWSLMAPGMAIRASAEVFNNLEVFPDVRLAFAGEDKGQLAELNSAAGRSTGTDDGGILGVLNPTDTALH
jgi:hypothetical protein